MISPTRKRSYPGFRTLLGLKSNEGGAGCVGAAVGVVELAAVHEPDGPGSGEGGACGKAGGSRPAVRQCGERAQAVGWLVEFLTTFVLGEGSHH